MRETFSIPLNTKSILKTTAIMDTARKSFFSDTELLCDISLARSSQYHCSSRVFTTYYVRHLVPLKLSV